MNISTFYCHHCNRVKSHQSNFTVGYGIDQAGNKTCFDCCAIIDRDQMIDEGRIILYLDESGNKMHVTNWPGTLRFEVLSYRRGRHNIAGNRTDVWFRGPDGKVWHGVQYGNRSQLCHCGRTKQ